MELIRLLRRVVEHEPDPDLSEIRERFVRKVRIMKWDWLAEVFAIVFFGCLVFAVVAVMLLACKGC